MVNTYYDKSMKLWIAYYSDNIGQLGDAEYAPTKELVCFNLGREIGANPQKFARKIGDYMPAYEAELSAATAKKFGGNYGNYS